MQQQIKAAMQNHKEMLARFESTGLESIAAAAQLLVTALKNGGRIYICGNGGSAADAQHIACELVGKFLKDRKALPAMALVTDSSILTAIANDYGFESVFARQVEAFVRPGDILWAISTSGSSPNIIAAAELARKKGAKVLAFTGKNNCKLEKLADVCVCADAVTSAASQQIHQIAYHIICQIVEQNIFD